VNLANRDGGTPTFCRGWGRLPFDTSCPDITAHVLRAVEALAEVAEHAADRELAGRALVAVGRGLEWLMTHTDGGERFPAAPIGLYFAKLWYDDRLYPLTFTATAFERAARLLDNPPSGQGG